MSQYLCLFSLIYKVSIRRENAGSWNSGLEKEQILETYSAQLQKSWNSTKVIFGNNKKYWAEEVRQRGTHLATRVGGAPYPPGRAPLPHGPLLALRWPSSTIWSLSSRKKIISNLSGWDSASTRRNLGGTNLGLRQSCSIGDTSLREGENHRHRHHQRSSRREGANLHQRLHQHHRLSNPSSSLVSNLCTKASYWYLRVASIVDYSF